MRHPSDVTESSREICNTLRYQPACQPATDNPDTCQFQCCESTCRDRYCTHPHTHTHTPPRPIVAHRGSRSTVTAFPTSARTPYKAASRYSVSSNTKDGGAVCGSGGGFTRERAGGAAAAGAGRQVSARAPTRSASRVERARHTFEHRTLPLSLRTRCGNTPRRLLTPRHPIHTFF